MNFGDTFQKCPKCGRIHKENRDHDTHRHGDTCATAGAVNHPVM